MKVGQYLPIILILKSLVQKNLFIPVIFFILVLVLDLYKNKWYRKFSFFYTCYGTDIENLHSIPILNPVYRNSTWKRKILKPLHCETQTLKRLCCLSSTLQLVLWLRTEYPTHHLQPSVTKTTTSTRPTSNSSQYRLNHPNQTLSHHFMTLQKPKKKMSIYQKIKNNQPKH